MVKCTITPAKAAGVRVFVYCLNHRQLQSRRYPNYAFHLIAFVHSPN
jgi:hypothetical protein